MNLSQQIQQWFAQDGPYLSGVALYRQAGGEYPASCFDGYERATYVPETLELRLRYALQAYLEKHPAVEEEIEDKRTIVQTKKDPEEPQAILELRQKARALHKQHAHVKAQLGVVPTDEQRLELTQQIMEELIPQLDMIYHQIRHWQATGALPEAPPDDAIQKAILETVEKMNRKGTLTSRISLLKSKLRKKDLDDKRRQKYQKELIDKQVELQAIEDSLPKRSR